MAKFVKLEDGNYINTDFINYIGVRDDVCIAYTIDDNDIGFRISGNDVDNILKASEQND